MTRGPLLRRPRLVAVLGTIAAGALLVIAATQTWATASLVAGGEPLAASGAAAVPVLAPLGLAAIALGLALTVVGLVLRLVLGVVAALIGGVLAVLSARVATTHPLDAVAGAVTDATGIAGTGVADLVGGVGVTVWPWVALAASVLLVLAGALTAVTGRDWGRTGRRFEADTATAPARPHDAVDSWDDLSRGADPTA